jgi:hypothetical protein
MYNACRSQLASRVAVLAALALPVGHASCSMGIGSCAGSGDCHSRLNEFKCYERACL